MRSCLHIRAWPNSFGPMNDLSSLRHSRTTQADDPAQVQRHALRLLEQGRAQEAAAVLAPALARHAENGKLHHLHGLVLMGIEGRLADAVAALEQAERLLGEDAGLLADLGRAYGLQKRRGPAEAKLRAALALRPEIASAWFALGQLHEQTSAWADAEDCLDRVVALAPRTAKAWVMLGKVRDQRGNFEGAMAAYRVALEIEPGNAIAQGAMAKTLEAYGHRAEAAEAYRRALARKPGTLTWQSALLRLDADRMQPGELEAAQQAAKDPETRMHLSFALARRAEAAERYEAALAYLAEANRLARAEVPHDRNATAAAFTEAWTTFTPEIFAKWQDSGHADPTPIFVIGMPRSGTTLTEQILASHPDVHGAGELPYLRQIVGAAARNSGATGSAEVIDRIGADGLAEIGRDYMKRLRQLSDKRFVVDKLPGNTMLVGMIRLALPRAKIVHVTRDAADNALSIYKNHFGAQLTFAYDFEDLGHYHRHYRQLMRHWHQVLPGFLYDVAYEALVAEQEAETRRLLDWVGLAFDPACLRFYETVRPVHTVSINQVRAPVHDRSIGLARRYGEGLRPLLTALGTD